MAQCCRTRFMRVTHVIFDLDGLLLDTERLYTEVVQGILDQYGKKFTWDMKLAIMGMHASDGAKLLVEHYELPITAEELTRRHKEAALLVVGKAQLMPGAERLIRHLHAYKVPMAVATSSGRDLVDLKTAKYKDLFNCFQHVVCGATDPELQKGKPAPDIFLLTASRFADRPCRRKCLVFEDAPNGVQAARNACMQCVMVIPDGVLIPPHLRCNATLTLRSLRDFIPEHFGLPPYQENCQCVQV